MSIVVVPCTTAAAAAAAAADANANEETPEMLFRQTVAAWQSSSSRSSNSRSSWKPWVLFSQELWKRFESESESESESEPLSSNSNNPRLEIVGALEEGILAIERTVFEQGQGENAIRDAALSQLYMVYAQTLMSLSQQECLKLALDPHTLLMGVESIIKDKKMKQQQQQLSDDNDDNDDSNIIICVENAENSLRNAATLDATNARAAELLQTLTDDNEDTVHKRKPKEFVQELFDSFADSFDEKLLVHLQYKVPELVGGLAQKLLLSSSTSTSTLKDSKNHNAYETVLDAGCGTGLAGRYLRPLMSEEGAFLLGVDASQKMLDKAADCTIHSGCGLKPSDTDEAKTANGDGNSISNGRPLLYDSLLKMDLEEMTLANTVPLSPSNNKRGFDLIVAADVFVYFGSLETVLATFAQLSLQQPKKNEASSRLIFSCELANEEEAPLGWRLLGSGRFAHTKQHALDMATKVGYEIVHYEEIVPRMEKGEPVRGHLFGFELKRDTITSISMSQEEL